MRLSVIIVNYNVKYFLEQALLSVKRAGEHIDMEVVVVDNASHDGSVDMVASKFPWVKLIANSKNTGFSTANNQGIKASTGEYVLLLNPDTVVEEDCFTKCLQFMDSHSNCGALGVKMLDGKGKFLPESKRALPTPQVSFFKIFGFSSLFPRSKTFGRYHLGYLNDNETHEVEVLPGAFMFMRREALNRVGLLDEDFFMYGEDIDLSYRILKGGYKVYYYPDARIIHYKGESTKKGSLNYVRIFYQAMIIFARKHFSERNAQLYSLAINMAVYARAAIAIVTRFVRTLMLPVLDAAVLFGGMYLIKDFWTHSIKNADQYYPQEYMLYIVPVYIFVWLLAVFFSGGYDRPLRTFRTVRGVLTGTLLIAAVYAFLPNDLRYSRGMILAGAVYATFALVALRYIYGYLTGSTPLLRENDTTRIIIAGSGSEARRALSLISQAGVESRYVGFVSPLEQDKKDEYYLDSVEQLYKVQQTFKVKEVIFCSQDVSVKDILDFMIGLGTSINYKILPPGSDSIIGSNSKNTAGDLYAIDINLAISTAMNRRNKRLFDLFVCLFTLVVYPIGVFFIQDPMQFIKNWWLVLFGRKTWVGYAELSGDNKNYWLPPLKEGVLNPVHGIPDKKVNDPTRARLNLLYAKDYKVYQDLRIVFKNYRCLGQCYAV